MEQNVVIQQKFLVSGHTQMECDSVHSVVERKMHNCDMFIPRDYVVTIQMARQNPSPYAVTEVTYSEPHKLSSDYVKSIRPGKKTSDPTVSDVCAYQYSSDADGVYIKYKVNWDDDWADLPVRVATATKNWVRLYANRLPISDRKYRDLLSFKDVVPQIAFDFYVNLPHL